jgi:hypothetical protein
MNKHILFVIDHLANPGKYTQEELDTNYYDVFDSDDNGKPWVITCFAATDAALGLNAAHWVDKYFKITGEDKQTYIDKLKG